MTEENLSLEDVDQQIDAAIEAWCHTEDSFPVYGGIVHKLFSICPFIMMIGSLTLSAFGGGVEAEVKRWGLLIVAAIMWAVYNVINLFYYVKISLECYELHAVREEILNESKDKV